MLKITQFILFVIIVIITIGSYVVLYYTRDFSWIAPSFLGTVIIGLDLYGEYRLYNLYKETEAQVKEIREEIEEILKRIHFNGEE